MDMKESVSPTVAPSDPASTSLMRDLSAWDGFSIVAGSVIGSGIFLVPGTIAHQLVSARSVLLLWVVGGALSVFGALSLAEMASMFPSAGGLYTYLREAYGNAIAFLYGWGLLLMIQTGSIATLSTGFALYLSALLPLSAAEQKIVAIATILALTAGNLISIHSAKKIQNVGMMAKFIGLFGLIVILLVKGHAATFSSGWNSEERGGLLAYGISLVAVLWAYEGWHVVSFTAGEFRNPQRDLPRSLLGGTLFVATIYIVMNIGYYAVLNPGTVAASVTTAATSVQAAAGPIAVRFVSVLILVSILVATNGMILTGPRVYYAMARDRVFFQSLGRTTPQSKVPAHALIIQGVWASVLTVAGSFQQLFTSVVFTAWIFYGLAVAAVILLRIKRPEVFRSFRVPGYPVLPLMFILAAVTVVVSTIVSSPVRAASGIGLVLLGLPIFVLFRNNRKSAHPRAEDQSRAAR